MSTDLIPADQLAKLRELARQQAGIQLWKPAPGDVLEGVILGAKQIRGPFGEQPALVVGTPDGSRVAYWLTAWLKNELHQQGAQKGDLVSLTFCGQEVGRSGKRYNRMDLVVLRQGG